MTRVRGRGAPSAHGAWRAHLARAAAGLSLGPLVLAGIVAPAPPPGTQRASHVEVNLRASPGGALPACQIDGEEIASCARAVIEVVPRALRLVVPAAHADARDGP